MNQATPLLKLLVNFLSDFDATLREVYSSIKRCVRQLHRQHLRNFVDLCYRSHLPLRPEFTHQKSDSPIVYTFCLAFFCITLSACSSTGPNIPAPLIQPHLKTMDAAVKGPSDVNPPIPQQDTLKSATGIVEIPSPPISDKSSTVKQSPSASSADQPEQADITVAFDQIPLPDFIQAIYGVILKKNYNVDPQVASRKDLVTFHAAQLQTQGQIETATRLLLKSYGIAVIDLGTGFFRIVPDNTQAGYSPEIRRGRALPEVPMPMRPVFHLIELTAVRIPDATGWVRTMFGNKITMADDIQRNSVLISGTKEDVAAALETIQILDQPLMSGRKSIRINPVFWSADELVKRLSDILITEGYAIGMSAGQTGPIVLLPIQTLNTIIVFASDSKIMGHIVDWAKELDKPNKDAGVGGFFTYQARNANAADLVKIMQEVIGNSGKGLTSKVTINPATNTLIFQGGPENYTQYLNLLQELDKTARSALIEVTVAEVTLDETTTLGVEWAFNASGAKGFTYTGGTAGGIPLGGGALGGAVKTTGGIGIGTGGLTIARLGSQGDLRMLMNMLATSSKANVLSTPRIMARNNETASIQVGSEIPTINMQQTNAATAGTGVIQSVQYRNTGIILKIKPTIYSGDHIDLDITQEVSDSTRVGVASSPIIDTRKVDTHLTLQNGTPILLGGLMSQNNSRADTGVPLLKDLPVVGQLFRTNTDNSRKTELLILITPYIVSDDLDAQAITNAFRMRLGDWAHPAKTTEPSTPSTKNP